MTTKKFFDAFGAGPGFNGAFHEPATGWQILGNGYRVYNPVLMRFHSPDNLSPFGQGGLNAYMYCAGDPVNRVDPTGHVPGGLFWRRLVGGAQMPKGVQVAKVRLTSPITAPPGRIPSSQSQMPTLNLGIEEVPYEFRSTLSSGKESLGPIDDKFIAMLEDTKVHLVNNIEITKRWVRHIEIENAKPFGVRSYIAIDSWKKSAGNYASQIDSLDRALDYARNNIGLYSLAQSARKNFEIRRVAAKFNADMYGKALLKKMR